MPHRHHGGVDEAKEYIALHLAGPSLRGEDGGGGKGMITSNDKA